MARVISREFPEAKTRSLLVIDATTGQNGLAQAEVFKDVFSKSSLTLLRKACTPSDMLELGADGIKEIWHDEKVRAASDNKGKNLLAAAEQSIGCHRDSAIETAM